MEFKARPYGAKRLFTATIIFIPLIIYAVKDLADPWNASGYSYLRSAIIIILGITLPFTTAAKVTSRFVIEDGAYTFSNAFRKVVIAKKDVSKVCEGYRRTCKQPEPGKKLMGAFGINILAGKKLIFLDRFTFSEQYEELARRLKVKIAGEDPYHKDEKPLTEETRKRIRRTYIIAAAIVAPILVAFALYDPPSGQGLMFGETKLLAMLGFAGVYYMIIGKIVDEIERGARKAGEGKG